MNEIAKARLRQKLDECKMVDGCREWQGNPDTNGYGRFYHDYMDVKAHSAAYELEVGPILEGLELDHLCRNRICTTIAHLEPVTHRENVLRGTGGAAVNAAKTHCVRGHEFTEANTILVNKPSRPNQSRRCRTCKNEAHKLRMRRLRAS